MDIHSEGYHFLKNTNKRNYTVIRSHTPFTLLKKYFTKDELKGVNAWFSFYRENKCFDWAKLITTPSINLKEHLIHLFNINPDKIKVIPNILDTEFFRPYDKAESKDISILHVGRFERPKGVETLIDAFIRLNKEFDNIRLINVGMSRGNSLDFCKEKLKKSKLLNKVSFSGHIPYDELLKYYNNSDIVVVPSEIYESFSYTVAQAMACGKVVVASQIGGIPETTDNGKAGILFTPGDSLNLFEKLAQLIDNDDYRKRIGKRARHFAYNNFL